MVCIVWRFFFFQFKTFLHHLLMLFLGKTTSYVSCNHKRNGQNSGATCLKNIRRYERNVCANEEGRFAFIETYSTSGCNKTNESFVNFRIP